MVVPPATWPWEAIGETRHKAPARNAERVSVRIEELGGLRPADARPQNVDVRVAFIGWFGEFMKAVPRLLHPPNRNPGAPFAKKLKISSVVCFRNRCSYLNAHTMRLTLGSEMATLEP